MATSRRNFRSMQLSGTTQPVSRQPYTHPSRNLYIPHVPTYSRNASRPTSQPTSQPGTPRRIGGNGFATVPTVERMREQLRVDDTRTNPLQQPPNPYTIKLSIPPNISTNYPLVTNTTAVMNSIAETVDARQRAMENRSLAVTIAKQQQQQQQARALQMEQEQQQQQQEQQQARALQMEQQQQQQQARALQMEQEQQQQERRGGHNESFQRHKKNQQQAKMHALAQSEVVGTGARARANIPTWEHNGSGSTTTINR